MIETKDKIYIQEVCDFIKTYWKVFRPKKIDLYIMLQSFPDHLRLHLKLTWIKKLIFSPKGAMAIFFSVKL